jgi:hypothetical protein
VEIELLNLRVYLLTAYQKNDSKSIRYICIVVGDPVIGKEGWDPINWFDPAIFVCLSQASVWISNVIWCGLFVSNKFGLDER